MKLSATIFTFFIFIQTIFSQQTSVNEFSSIDNKALELPDSLTTTTEGIASYIRANFNTDNEKTRAIYTWLVNNIKYDIENIFAINFYERKEDKIAKALKSKKGICENYAALFNDICIKSGIKSFVIEGYTKQNGFTDYMPHAWCAALVDSLWFLFDPTWGSGYINGGKFIKKTDYTFFKANPSKLIKSHMPFDYLWQFLDYPLTNQEFYENRTQLNKSKPYFNYADSIRSFENLNYIDQLTSSAYRIEKNGVKNSLIFDRLQHIKLEIENDRQSKVVNIFNTAVIDYNDGVNEFNDFINYRNKQFVPKKPDQLIQDMLNVSENKINEAKTKLAQINNPDANTAKMIIQLTKSINDVLVQVEEQQKWLKIYFGKGKTGRKMMFYERR